VVDTARGQLVHVDRLRQAGRHRIDRHAATVLQDQRGGGAEIAHVQVGVVAAGTR
jgi:hypothetical protein